MELSTAGDRWEMVAELSRRVAGRALPPRHAQAYGRSGCHGGDLLERAVGDGVGLSQWVQVTKLCLQGKQLQSVPDRAAPRALGAVRGQPSPGPTAWGAALWLPRLGSSSATCRVGAWGWGQGWQRGCGQGTSALGIRAPALRQPRSPQPCSGLWGSPAIPSRSAVSQLGW